jgi:deoxyribodipyrimidine photo-lyase
MRTLVWFRGKDLRLADHPALTRAVAHSTQLALVFVLQAKYFGPGAGDAAPHRVQALLAALRELAAAIEARGNRLLILRGPALEVLPALVERLALEAVYVSGSVEPAARALEQRLARSLRVPLHVCDGETLAPAAAVRTREGGAFRVYTPFARAFRAQQQVAAALPAPRRLPPPPEVVALASLPVPGLRELGIADNPQVLKVGERAAHARMQAFLAGASGGYAALRDRVDLDGTSRLSADLHFGTLSIRSLWNAAQARLPEATRARERFTAQLLWREFAHHTLLAYPRVLHEPFRADYAKFPWRHTASAFDAWAAGMTGYPIVDAAARQLTREGFVHNRARMIAASFLTKHLLVPYTSGEAHYSRWLVDADLAQNNLGWQWCAGTGCDAQPYFRVFSPERQGERFDPNGDYVRRYVPELAGVAAAHIHAPWRAPLSVLQRAGVVLGRTYPRPIVDHDSARQRFLLIASAPR